MFVVILCGCVRPILNPPRPRSVAGWHRFDRATANQSESCSNPRRGTRENGTVAGAWSGRKRATVGGRRGTPSRRGFEIQKNWGAAWCFRAMRVFWVINAVNVESMELACRNVTEEPSEANLVKLLDLWSAGGSTGGAPGPWGRGLTKDNATLGLFGHGGVVGVSNATGLREACAAVNRFLKSRFPQGTWTSIAVLFNPRMGLHRDIQNMPGHSNHALALGDYTGGRVWIEDDEGTPQPGLDDKKGGARATRQMAGHARQARQLRCSPLS